MLRRFSNARGRKNTQLHLPLLGSLGDVGAGGSGSSARSRKYWLMIRILLWGGGFLCVYVLYRWGWKRIQKRLRLSSGWYEAQEGEHVFDVCIVGAGPSGSSCAYYLARANKKVLMIEKQPFPHDKVCGDVITPLAQIHLKEMGVLDEIVEEKEGKWATSGGFVSPTGKSFIGKLTTGERLLSVQRIILDDKIARAAEAAGATLYDGSEVQAVVFDDKKGIWTITLSICDLNGTNYSFQARALVAADGAESLLARRLGVVTSPPTAYCSRSFAKAGTHSFPNADHVVFYPTKLLPGYFTVFHELEDFLNLCCYFIPCKGKWSNSTIEELQDIYEYCLKSDPFIKQTLGPDVVITPCKFAPIRVGGVPRSYAEHFLVVGDAAGQVDPLTGGGIHYGMEAGKIAAETLIDGLEEFDLSEERMKIYQDRWKAKFGFEFRLAQILLYMLYKFPILLDAGAEVIKRKGEGFVGAWATAMMGGRSKMWFFYPTCAGPVLWESFVLWWKSLWKTKKK